MQTRSFRSLLSGRCSRPAPAAAAPPAGRGSRWRRCARSTSGWRRSGIGSPSPASTVRGPRLAARLRAPRPLAIWRGDSARPRSAPSGSTPVPACSRSLPAGRPSAPGCAPTTSCSRSTAGRRRAARPGATARSTRWSGSSPRWTRPSPTARATIEVRRGGRAAAPSRSRRSRAARPASSSSPARRLNARADGRYVQLTHGDRRICRRRRRAGGGARPRIRP